MRPSKTAVLRQPPPFSRLSSDLKLDIFGLIRSKHDQGIARLVCRDWNHHVRYQMFKRIKTSLRSSFPQDSAQPAAGEDFCFSDIRSLIVGGRHENPDLHDESTQFTTARFSSPCRPMKRRCVGPKYDARFSSLMHRFHDDQLVEFESPRETPLTGAQLIDLLNHQANLRTFRARMDLSDIVDEDRVSWNAKNVPLFFSALRCLRTLRIYVGYHSTNASPDSYPYAENLNGLLLRASFLLESLEICGWPHVWSSERRRDPGVPLMAVFGNSENSVHIPQTLRHLLLADMDLKYESDIFLDAVNISRIRSLKIEYCRRPWDFCSRLAWKLQRTNGQLKALTIRTDRQDRTGESAFRDGGVRELLLSFRGLEKLEVDAAWAGNVDWPLCLSPHQNLKSCLISSSGLDHISKPSPIRTIADILRHCPKLQTFACRPESHFLKASLDCPIETQFFPEFQICLDFIAAVPTIKTLRLLSAPGIEDGRLYDGLITGLRCRGNLEWAEKAGETAQRRASLILAYLHSKGSNVKVLALSPASRWEQHRGDRNLHYYPHYFYEARIVEQDGKQIVEAFPLRDYMAENPDAAVYV